MASYEKRVSLRIYNPRWRDWGVNCHLGHGEKNIAEKGSTDQFREKVKEDYSKGA